uniref:BTB domain-containing protein n=1 Tax=Parascaris univalens TaxID=6257 RepID=A0A914ZSU3_PARUN
MESETVVRSESQLSLLSARTCIDEFDDFVPLPSSEYRVLFSIHVSEIGALRSEFRPGGGIRFHLPVVDLVIASSNETKENLVVDIFGESKEKNIEWRYVMQMRFRTGTNMIGSDRVVDGDIFEIGNRCRPIVLRIADPQVKRIRIEIRFINKMLNFLPKFDEGDVTLRFGAQSLQVHGALLGLHSNHMAMKIKEAGESGIIDMDDCDISAFKEVLYQVYPTKHPIWSDFKGITKAAIKFKVSGVLEMVKKYLINYEHMYLEQKIAESIKLQLWEAVEELVYKAEHDGFWTTMIHSGLNPEQEFGATIYHDVILPAIAKAKAVPIGTPLRKPFFDEVIFRSASEAWNPFNVALIVQGIPLYVNRGILAINNDKMFGRGNKGELIVRITVDLTDECHKIKKIPLEIVEALLRHIYPLKKPIPAEMLRAMLALTYAHQMYHVIDYVEECLMQEPPISAQQFLEHFSLAEKYGLENLLLKSLHRIEKSCKHLAMQMTGSPDFAKLCERTRWLIMDRYCSGWALGRIEATKQLNREIRINTGGETKSMYEYDKNLSTLMNVNSEEAFGAIEEKTIV